MSAIENKQLMETIFAALAKGNTDPLFDAMADDMQWTWMGSGPWSKAFTGKKAVIGELWSAVKKTLVPPYKATAINFIAEGDYVVMEANGENATPDGKIYNNKYCWVCRITDGKLHELREYMDTQLVTETFAASKK
jgi:uncharacterized protein